MWYLQFSSCENGAFLLMEATVCCRFYYWSEIEVIQTNQSTYTSGIARLLLKWNGCDWRFNALHNCVLLLSCDYVLKFDWYCQLSGSRSNSLNSRKLPGRFSYGLQRFQVRFLLLDAVLDVAARLFDKHGSLWRFQQGWSLRSLQLLPCLIHTCNVPVAFRLIRTVQKIRNSACSMNSEGNKILKLVVRGIRMFE